MIWRVLRLALCLLLAVALGAAGLASAGATDRARPLDTPIVADLNGDGVDDTVSAHETVCYTRHGQKPPPCAKDVLRSLFVEVTAPCDGGTSSLQLSDELDDVTLARLIDADGDGKARELGFELRAGATGRGVQAKVVSFATGADGCVAVRKTLFSYPRPASIGPRPKGTTFSTGSLAVHDFSATFPGPELRTTEFYARAADPGCCPSFRRVTFWRYVPSPAGYKPYSTKLTTLPKQF
jgi:hypothetical protein